MHQPRVSTPFPGPKAREILALDRKFMSQSMTRLDPIVAEQGCGCWISDVDGNLFLDFTAGIAVNATGCLHPQITEAIEKQTHRSPGFLARRFLPLARRPACAEARGAVPWAGRRRARVLCNSGAEAVEAAIQLARWHTKRTQLVAFHGAFHGRTTGALALSESKPIHKEGFGPLLAGVTHVPYSLSGLQFLDQTLFKAVVAGIFVEPIQGEHGVIVPENGFLGGLRRLCDRHGILLVADEVQTGMGRTGKMFACEHWGIVPDIICVAKGVASGLPLGAIIAKAGVMDWPASKHTSTFGGNPLSCAAALATIDVLQGGLIENAAAMGQSPPATGCATSQPGSRSSTKCADADCLSALSWRATASLPSRSAKRFWKMRRGTNRCRSAEAKASCGCARRWSSPPRKSASRWKYLKTRSTKF